MFVICIAFSLAWRLTAVLFVVDRLSELTFAHFSDVHRIDALSFRSFIMFNTASEFGTTVLWARTLRDWFRAVRQDALLTVRTLFAFILIFGEVFLIEHWLLLQFVLVCRDESSIAEL